MTQPNVYWTLTDDLVSIVGLYTNVPEGGQVHQEQIEWLVGELQGAPADRALIVALHHPPYSADSHHGGSARMGALLDEAFQHSSRVPEMVLSGDVHNYQRFTRTIAGKQVPYIVAGAGGYHNLHKMAKASGGGALELPFTAAEDCELEAFCDDQWGFLRLSLTAGQIAGEYIAVAKDGTVTLTGTRSPPRGTFSTRARLAAHQFRDIGIPATTVRIISVAATTVRIIGIAASTVQI